LSVEAYPEEVFAYLEDLEAFNRWSPWFARDPDADYIFGNVDYGKRLNLFKPLCF